MWGLSLDDWGWVGVHVAVGVAMVAFGVGVWFFDRGSMERLERAIELDRLEREWLAEGWRRCGELGRRAGGDL